MKTRQILIPGLLVFVLLMAGCSNPVDIIEVTKIAVMEANNRFLVLDSQFPAANSVDINPSEVIRAVFDRGVIEASIYENIEVCYADGVNLINESWLVDYNDVVRTLKIEPFPFLQNQKTITVRLKKGVVALDGSELKETLVWSFTTNNEVAYSANFGTATGSILYYANKDLDLARGENKIIPIVLGFTSVDNLKYLISDSINTKDLLPLPTDSTWKTVVTDSTEIDTEVFPDEGVGRRYIWAYDMDKNDTLTNFPREIQIFVDRTLPEFDLGSAVITNAAMAFEPTVTESGAGIASYEWSGTNLSISTPSENNVTVSSSLQGDHTLSLKVTDQAGNFLSDSVDITWDTIAPAAPTAPDLAGADDTGNSNSDNITKNTTNLTYSGTAEASSTIELYTGTILLGTTTADVSGNWSADVSRSEGVYQIYTTATDVAGNTSLVSDSTSLTVDTSITTPAIPDLAASDDSGTSNSDNITNKISALTFSGTAEVNAAVNLKVAGISIATTVADGSGDWNMDVSRTAGTHSMTVSQTDIAGNTSVNSSALSLVVDTSAAAPSIPDLAVADDTGWSTTDNLTKNTTGLTISGGSEPYASVQIKSGGTNLVAATASSSGTWTADISRGAGSHSITAAQIDLAGNSSTDSSVLALTIDTTAPTSPSTPDLYATDDTGWYNNDNLTKNTTALTFSGTNATVGTRLYLQRSSTDLTYYSPTSTSWSRDATTLATNTTHSIRAVSEDAAGNRSYSAYLSITIDTAAPTTPSTPDLYYLDDTGSSTSDNITKNTTGLTFKGTGSTSGCRLYLQRSGIDLTYYNPTSTSWSRDATTLTANTSNSIRAVSEDRAGNRSYSGYLSVKIDTVRPSNGVWRINSNTTYTNNGTVTLALTTAPSDNYSGVAQMQFSNNTSLWSSPETYYSSKSWSITSTTYGGSTSNGNRYACVRVIDKAGNIASGYAYDYIIYDNVKPVITSFYIGSGNPSSTNSAANTLYIAATDSTSGVYQTRYGNYGQAWTAYETYVTSKTWTLQDKAGTRRVYAMVKDRAGNESTLNLNYDEIVLNARITVTYTRLYISGDGDSFGNGEIYYRFYIDGVLKLNRAESSYISLSSGTTIYTGMPAAYTFYENPTSGLFTMTGTVYDSDDPSIDDKGIMSSWTDPAPFSTYSTSRSVSGDVSGTIYYTVTFQNP